MKQWYAPFEKEISKIREECSVRTTEVKERWVKAMEKKFDLTAGDIVIETRNEVEKRRGVFQHFYHSLSLEWVVVKLIKKDGSIGSREFTFYNWIKL